MAIDENTAGSNQKRSCQSMRSRKLLILVPCLMVLLSVNSVFAQMVSKNLPILVHADEIRRLTPEQAALGYPVRIRGVITMDAPAPDFFLQDATAGIYVEGSVSPRYPHLLGQMVEVEGVTGPGKFAPVIREAALHVLGKGSLPKARLFAFSQLANGEEDSQW